MICKYTWVALKDDKSKINCAIISSCGSENYLSLNNINNCVEHIKKNNEYVERHSPNVFSSITGCLSNFNYIYIKKVKVEDLYSENSSSYLLTTGKGNSTFPYFVVRKYGNLETGTEFFIIFQTNETTKTGAKKYIDTICPEKHKNKNINICYVEESQELDYLLSNYTSPNHLPIAKFNSSKTLKSIDGNTYLWLVGDPLPFEGNQKLRDEFCKKPEEKKITKPKKPRIKSNTTLCYRCGLKLNKTGENLSFVGEILHFPSEKMNFSFLSEKYLDALCINGSCNCTCSGCGDICGSECDDGCHCLCECSQEKKKSGAKTHVNFHNHCFMEHLGIKPIIETATTAEILKFQNTIQLLELDKQGLDLLLADAKSENKNLESTWSNSFKALEREKVACQENYKLLEQKLENIKALPSGLSCINCKEFSPHNQSNQTNGTYICKNCA